MTEKKAKLSRRNFLLTVGAGGAATAAAIVTAKSTPHRGKRRRTSVRRAATRPPSTSTTTTAPRRSKEGRMLLTRKATSQAAPQARLARAPPARSRRPWTAARSSSARASRVGAGAVASQLPFSMIGEAEAQGRGRRQDRSEAHGLHALLRGLRDRRRGAERRLDPPGAGVRLADQPRRALRQGRLGARARHHARLAPPQVPDEARGRQVEEASPGTRPTTRSRRRCSRSARRAARIRCSWSAPPSTTTSRPSCCASGCASGAPTTPTTRRASATRPPSPAWPRPGATAR